MEVEPRFFLRKCPTSVHNSVVWISAEGLGSAALRELRWTLARERFLEKQAHATQAKRTRIKSFAVLEAPGKLEVSKWAC